MRPDWDSYFLKIAYAVSERSTCDRAFVGCVLVLEKRILTTGFNGSPAGQGHCDEIGHLMVDGHCVRTIHAETNAIIQAALHMESPRKARCVTSPTCHASIAQKSLSTLEFHVLFTAPRIEPMKTPGIFSMPRILKLCKKNLRLN